MKNNFILILVLIVSLNMYTHTVYAQKGTQRIGAQITNEYAIGDDGAFTIGGGINYETKFANKFGLDIALNYRNAINGYWVNGTIGDVPYRTHYLSYAFVAKYYSKWANISIGPTLDFNIANTYTSKQIGAFIESPHIDNALIFGAIFKVGKEIKITNNVIFEPEIRYSAPINGDSPVWFGFGFGLKRLF